jgi:hypothetical protein
VTATHGGTMRNLKLLRRRFGALLIFAVAAVALMTGLSRPAAALPIQANPGPSPSCPASLPDEPGASYTLITAGPLGPNSPGGPYCGQTGGPLNPTSGGECPLGYTDAKGGTFNVPVCDLIGNVVAPSQANKNRQKQILQLAIAVANMSAAGLTDQQIAESLGITPEALAFLGSVYNNASHLGMYTDGSSSPYSGLGGFGGGLAMHGSGYGLTDTAGLAAPGATTPSFKSVSGNGGIAGTYDASRLLPSNQYLFFSGLFDDSTFDISGGASPGLPVSTGSARFDLYTFAASALYYNNRAYLQTTGAFTFGHGNETQNIDGSTGSFNTNSYWADARLGRVFVLWQTAATPSVRALPIKAVPKSAGGFVLGLDLSGHLGYFEQQVGSFTDSSGFIFGTDKTKYGDTGARAKLFALVPQNGLTWEPYVAVTLDRQFGFSSVLNVPNQPTFVGGDVLSLQQAETFWGGQWGLDVYGANGWTAGVKGFYTASADITIAGGSAYIKIPFNSLPFVATKY